MLDLPFGGKWCNDDLKLERVARVVASLAVMHFARRHSCLMLALTLADVAVKVGRSGKEKQKLSKLPLFKEFQ